MDAKKGNRLEAAGWKTGTAAEFLELSAEEAALVGTRLAVSRELRTRRQEPDVPRRPSTEADCCERERGPEGQLLATLPFGRDA
jgi:hypothetical protein